MHNLMHTHANTQTFLTEVWHPQPLWCFSLHDVRRSPSPLPDGRRIYPFCLNNDMH